MGRGQPGRTPGSLGTMGGGGCLGRGTVRQAREPGALVDGAVVQQVPEEGAVYCQPVRQLHRLQSAGEMPLACQAMPQHTLPRGGGILAALSLGLGACRRAWLCPAQP